jgi:hypothetical protein
VNSAKLNDWMQVIGIFAVVASLLFVGLQMRQAQKISMSQTYQSRTAAVAEWNSAFAANPAALSALRKARDGTENEITTQEYDALSQSLTGVYYLYDNAHYQYQVGFVSEEFWEASRGSLSGFMEAPIVYDIFADISKRAGRPEFRDLVREIGKQLDTQEDD